VCAVANAGQSAAISAAGQIPPYNDQAKTGFNGAEDEGNTVLGVMPKQFKPPADDG
jgi:hypothetical protein